jgi:hypothetical protein
MKIMMRKFMKIIACLFIIFGVTNIASANEWEMTIKAKAGDAENKLVIGQRSDATDGIDGRFDVSAFLAGDIEAYIADVNGEALWKDIKKACDDPCSKSWDLIVDSKTGSETVTVSWSMENISEDISFTLIDTTNGKSVDMMSHSSYAFTGDGQRRLLVEAKK